jgi:hypothetical protein
LGVLVYNRHTFEIVSACPTVPEEFGYQADDFVGLDRRLLCDGHCEMDTVLKSISDCGFAFGRMQYRLSTGERQERYYRAMRVDAGPNSFIIEDTFTLSTQAHLFEAWLRDTPDLSRAIVASLRAADFTLKGSGRTPLC